MWVSHMFNRDINMDMDLYEDSEVNDPLFYHTIKRVQILTFEDSLKNKSSFNKSIVLTPNITHLTFGTCFNQPIVFTLRIEHLIFGKHFNCPIVLPCSIKFLTLGCAFNQPITLTINIMVVEFESCFGKPIVLSKNITHLSLGYYYYKQI